MPRIALKTNDKRIAEMRKSLDSGRQKYGTKKMTKR